MLTCAVIYAHSSLLELRTGHISQSGFDIDTMHMWNVAITMVGLRCILFASQPWYIVFGASVFLGTIEAHAHGAYTKLMFSARKNILFAFHDTLMAALLIRGSVSGSASVLRMAFIPPCTHIMNQFPRGVSMLIMDIFRPLVALEVASLCTWQRTRNVARVGPLFA